MFQSQAFLHVVGTCIFELKYLWPGSRSWRHMYVGCAKLTLC